MKQQLSLAAVLFSLCSLTYAATYTADDLKAMADKLNKEGPTMVDKATKLMNVSFENSTFHYHYQIIESLSSSFDPKKFDTIMRQSLTKTVCGDQFAKDLFKSNFDLSFDYIDKDGKPLTNIVFKPADCPTS